MSIAATAPIGSRGVHPAVLISALATSLGGVPTLFGLQSDRMPDWALASAGWSGFGIAAALLLDRDPRSRSGWAFVGLSLLPLTTTIFPALRTAPKDGSWAQMWDRGLLAVALTSAVITWSAGIASDRTSRRRLIWSATWCVVMFGVVCAAQVFLEVRSSSVVLSVGMATLAAVVTRLVLLRELRPIDEPLVDTGVLVGGLLIGAVGGSLMRWVLLRGGLPQADLSGAFVAVVAGALGGSAGLWLRRSYLERKYGSGSLSPEDVAALSTDLHPRSDPRELLAKAAVMVAGATGHRDVRIVLGSDEVEAPSPWLANPLDVAGGRVGTLLIRSSHPEGPELRQSRVLAQMLPTVGLVAQAVTFAVAAEHARQDVARERTAERSRILGDLHDGVGPVLAGMSMRVQAELRRAPTPLLLTLTDDLAACRSDLRRIVSGLTPSALHGRDIDEALEQLVNSFDGGPTLRLSTHLDRPLAPEVALAVYRTVAEGVTNALRHGHAEHVEVSARTVAGDVVLVEVCDDGSGGVIVPGVGLTSLRRRAEHVGGCLHVGPVQPRGTRLRVELPTTGGLR